MANSSTKVITGPDTVFSYLTVLEPKTPPGGGTPKYSVSLIIPKSDTVTVQKIRDAIQAAYEKDEGKLRGSGKTVPPLSSIHSPLRDGDRDKADDPAYKNAWFLNATGKTRPGIVDANLQEITDPSELYSGIIGRASVNFYAYNSNGNRGIGCGLNNLQKLKDGTPLGSFSRAADDFAGLDDGEEDFLG